MKAMQLTGIRKMELAEKPTPLLKEANEVLVRVTQVGVCGSDVHYFEEGRIGSQIVEFPFTVGHEAAGVVEACGSGVRAVAPGDRIAIEPAMPCLKCNQCKAGRLNTCSNLRFTGCPGQADGCLAECIVLPEHSCFKIPDTMTDEEAALSEPLTIGVYALKLAALAPKARIGVLGSGPIGLSVILPAATGVAERIYVTDKLEYRLGFAKRAGATWGGNPDREHVVDSLSMLEPDGLDAVFECCGTQEAVDHAIEILKPGGKLVIIGIPPTLDRFSFAVDKMRRKEISIQNVRRQNKCLQSSLDMIENKRFEVGMMVTHRFKLEEAQQAFELVSGYADGVVKAMIQVG